MSLVASQLVIGQYIPGRSPIHRGNPLVKVILTLLVMTALLVTTHARAYAAVAALWLAGYLASGLTLRFFLMGVRPILWLVGFTLVLHVTLTPGTPLAPSGIMYYMSREGLENGLAFSARLLLIVMFTSLLTLTTSSVELTKAIERLSAPLKPVGFPAAEFAMMLTIALRFIPVLFLEMDKIMKAQRCRGASFSSHNPSVLARSYTAILVPLFVNTFNRATDLALAMEVRGYQTGKARGSLRVYPVSPLDLLLALAVGAALAAGLLGHAA